jgi:hypothetical protein
VNRPPTQGDDGPLRVLPDSADGDSNGNLDPRAVEMAQIARKTLGQMSPKLRARGIDALHRLVVRRQSIRRRIALVTVAAAAGVAIAFGPRVLDRFNQEPAPPPLAFIVEGGAVDASGAVRSRTDTQPPALHFGDGTVISFDTGTTGRVATVDARGAHIAITHGRARVDVVPKPQARWQIDAGPFVINVHGTVFSAEWDAKTERLEVNLERGAVSVTGPVTNGPIAMRAGQSLIVKLRRSEVVLRDTDDQEHEAEAPALAPAPVRTRAVAAARPSRPVRQARSWAAALSAGDFDSILEEAERDIGHTLATRGTEDLAALADAARYRRHDDVARRALLAQRRRFPASPRAADAAFQLGRLDENAGRGAAPALAWYERYLDEAPNGTYAAEALGRKMIAVEDLHGAGAARSVAEQYVRRFPRGSYAGAARALRGQER